MVFLEKAGHLEHTNFDKLSQKLAVLQIPIISDQLYKSLGQELTVIMDLSLCDNWRVIAELAIRCHFNQEIQSEFQGFRLRVLVVELFKQIGNCSASQRIQIVYNRLFLVALWCVHCQPNAWSRLLGRLHHFLLVQALQLRHCRTQTCTYWLRGKFWFNFLLRFILGFLRFFLNLFDLLFYRRLIFFRWLRSLLYFFLQLFYFLRLLLF